ncbi:MAG TPA: TetR/AcrR family transcriptional regulator [Gammaproteobacteria bacterium]|nr:TetR/AcrR family transcriptional regulator [Gammaproteobacteria bacterium]
MKNDILDCAQALIQIRGYNGFSYADVSDTVGIRKASIHHHFPTKVDLAVAVVQRYRDAFNARLLNISHQKNASSHIRLYAELYQEALSQDKLCLCGMLASDMETLPDEVKKVVRGFLSDNAAWLVTVLHNNYPKISKKRLINIAWQIINLLQGGMIMARVSQDPGMFSASIKEMISQLKYLS